MVKSSVLEVYLLYLNFENATRCMIKLSRNYVQSVILFPPSIENISTHIMRQLTWQLDSGAVYRFATVFQLNIENIPANKITFPMTVTTWSYLSITWRNLFMWFDLRAFMEWLGWTLCFETKMNTFYVWRQIDANWCPADENRVPWNVNLHTKYLFMPSLTRTNAYMKYICLM